MDPPLGSLVTRVLSPNSTRPTIVAMTGVSNVTLHDSTLLCHKTNKFVLSAPEGFAKHPN